MKAILDGLNPAQQAAVTSDADVVQVLAPPGSGKTKTLTTRLAYLLQTYNYKPWNVICLTFTVKSAREMRDRVSKLLSNGTENRVVLGTFHSVCRRYLVAYGHLIGLRKGFGIADTSDTISIIKRILKRRKFMIEPQKAQARISNSKSKGLTIDAIMHTLRASKNVEQQEFIVVYEEYEHQLAASNLLDYDDLLLRCSDLLRDHPECVSNVEAVLIDEFQDTNVVQFDLMNLFAAKHKRVTTVGDMDQSIYGWRNAEIKNLERMGGEYPDTLVINLQENYRSSGAILHVANEIIEQDTSRSQKSMVPTHCPGTKPVLRRLPSPATEADWIVSELSRTRALTGELFTFSDYAILLRTASLSRLIEAKLGRAGVPYRMVGGHRFYDRAEIKILLDYLRVISQPSNNDAILRAINIPPRGVGDSTLKALLESSETSNRTLWKSLGMVLQGFGVSDVKVAKGAETGIGTFVRIVSICRNKLQNKLSPASPENLLRCIIDKINLKAYLKKHYQDDHESRWLNVEELVTQAGEFHINESVDAASDTTASDALPDIAEIEQATPNGAEEALSRFLANIALTSELQQEDKGEEEAKPHHRVTISTIHAAKGLEWPVVFVPSVYDGCIPHSRAEDTDEERRLLYVAMTRAQALLYLSCPVNNSRQGETTLSTFLVQPKIRSVFSDHGPTVGATAVNDIARILRRDCPTKDDIAEACLDLEHLEDNVWTADGTESVETVQARIAGWRQHEGPRSENTLKRRRVDFEAGQQGSMQVEYKTTMEEAHSFSVTNAGFITASAHMKTMPATMQSHGESDSRRQKQKKPDPQARARQPKLASLWGAKSDGPGKASRNCGSKTMIETTFTVIDADDHLAQREPLLPAPSALTNRRIPAIAHSSRPFSKSINQATASPSYVFLSSDDPPEEAAKVESPAAIDKTADLQAPSAISLQGNVPRKTLGVSRRVGEWKSGGGRGFTVPTMKKR